MTRIAMTATLGEVARTMETRGVGILLVVDPTGSPVGVITERHLLDAIAASRHPDHGTARSWMAPVIVDVAGAAQLPDTDTAALVAINLRAVA